MTDPAGALAAFASSHPVAGRARGEERVAHEERPDTCLRARAGMRAGVAGVAACVRERSPGMAVWTPPAWLRSTASGGLIDGEHAIAIVTLRSLAERWAGRSVPTTAMVAGLAAPPLRARRALVFTPSRCRQALCCERRSGRTGSVGSLAQSGARIRCGISGALGHRVGGGSASSLGWLACVGLVGVERRACGGRGSGGVGSVILRPAGTRIRPRGARGCRRRRAGSSR